MPIVEKIVKSWEDFVELTVAWDVGTGVPLTFGFRGQASATWALTHTLWRTLTQDRRRPLPSMDEALRHESDATKRFMAEAHSFIPITIYATSKGSSNWWCIMQHHGAPTRLIDWTYSPYVAAYFAVISHLETDGALFVLDLQVLGTVMRRRYGEAWDIPASRNAIEEEQYFQSGPPSICAIFRQTQTDRMVIQQSFFTVCRDVLANQDEVLSDLSLSHPQSRELLSEYVIPASLKPIFLRRLSGASAKCIV